MVWVFFCTSKQTQQPFVLFFVRLGSWNLYVAAVNSFGVALSSAVRAGEVAFSVTALVPWRGLSHTCLIIIISIILKLLQHGET